MNDRIYKLAKQAAAVEGWGPEVWQTTYSEKFAKLIVQECQFAIVSRTDLPRHERKLYNNVLKKHFGVEE
jgi:hypothetical protein